MYTFVQYIFAFFGKHAQVQDIPKNNGGSV
jgi:hypothetical protein